MPKEWIEAGADAVYRHAARLGVPAHTLTAGQLVTAALSGAVPLIREALALALGHQCDCAAVAPLHDGAESDPRGRLTGHPCDCITQEALDVLTGGAQ